MTTLHEALKRLVRQCVLATRKHDLYVYLGKGQEQQNHLTKVQNLSIQSVRQLEEYVAQGLIHENYYFYACDLFIRDCVEPSQEVLDRWMSGAKAQVAGEDIRFSDIIAWCQAQPSKERRDMLEREARALCRFLSPFSEATWQATFQAVTKELGYSDYLSFLFRKRGKGLKTGIERAKEFLNETKEGYFSIIDAWFDILPEPVRAGDRSRFDAIHLLGMRYLDFIYPDPWRGEGGIKKATSFFRSLVPAQQGLNLHIISSSGNSCCLPVRIPEEIHVFAGPLKGWIDLEGLFHELGHAYFFLKNEKDLPFAQRELYTEPALSEAFAFLFQLIVMDPVFLTELMGMEDDAAMQLSALQHVKFLTLARRYSAKSITEFENFHGQDNESSKEHYAKLLQHHTGFRYHPETYFFDLMPDLYSLDYFQAFIASLKMKDFLDKAFGAGWFLTKDAKDLLGSWARMGNSLSLAQFLERNIGSHSHFEQTFDFPLPDDKLHSYVKKMAQKV